MNTGADVSYLLKAQKCLKESEDAERAGMGFLAWAKAQDCIAYTGLWAVSINENEGLYDQKEAA